MGISKKLLFSFGSVTAATVISCTIAIIAFQNLSSSLINITEKSVPVMGKAISLTQAGASLTAAMPLLANAATEQERTSARDQIDNIVTDLASQISSIENDLKTGKTDKPDVIKNVEQSISRLDQAVAKKALTASEIVKNVTFKDELKTDIDTRLIKTIDRVAKKFIGTTNLIFKRNVSMLNSLLTENVESMVSALQLQNSIIEAQLVVNEVARMVQSTNSVTQLPVNRAIDASQRVMKLWADFPVTVVRKPEALQAGFEQFRLVAERLRDKAATEDIQQPGLKALIVETEKNMTFLRTVLIAELDTVVDTGYSQVQSKGKNLTRSATETLPEKIRQAKDKLTRLLELRAEFNVVSGILAQTLYVGDTKGLEHLEKQLGSVKVIVQELLEQSKNVQGMKPLTKKINQFLETGDGKRGLLKLRAEDLQNIAEIDVILNSVDRDKKAFDIFLVEQANTAQDAVVQSSESVHLLIEKSGFKMMLVSALSILFTVLIYWLLVSRYILKRLLTTIAALKSLSNGDYNVSVVDQRGDELGELARTVEVFRKSAEKSAKLQAEQDVLQREQQQQARIQKELEQTARLEREKHHQSEMAASEKQSRQDEALQKRVDALLVALSAIAGGDLDCPVNTEGDDVAGQMGRSLEQLVTEIRGSIRDINDNSNKLTLSSTDLTSLSAELKGNADSNVKHTSHAAEYTEKVIDGITSVSTAAEQMSSSIQDILGYTNEAESVAREAVVLAKSTDTTVKDLATSSSSIGTVVKLITTIAEQTNLLALNATIEAARAGDAGKGFAVVANEVKELAKETAKATQLIETRIHGIQSSTDTAVGAIEDICGIIDKISGIQETITAAIDEQTTMTKSIAKSVEQTSDGSFEIQRLLSSVSERVTENKDAAGSLAQAANSLADTAASQQQLVQRFKFDSKRQKAA